jgi:Protein kinase domain
MKQFPGESGRFWSYDDTTRIGDPSGMGAVFEGESESGDQVAIKRVRLPADTPENRRRRDRELEIADKLIAARRGGLSVDHLLLPIDRGWEGDDLLIVMPRAEESLAAAVRRGAVAEDDRLEAVREITRGLIELAAISVLHRDLKPENVLRHAGRWKLTDFGIARSLDERTGTFTFVGWGTPPYMAPELWELKPASVKSDLYALGIVAYELLLGSRPFDGPDQDDYRRQHLTEDPTEPATLDPRLQRLVLRLLRKDPNRRYQDARSVLEVLDRVGIALEPDQSALAEAAISADKRRSAADSLERGRRTAIEAAEAKRIQATADLEEILEEATERAAAALTEVTLQHDGLQWHFGIPEARLTIQPFTSHWFQDEHDDDPIVSAWAVYSSMYGDRSAIANIVCEDRPGGLQLFLLRFAASAMVGNNYGLGPVGHPHGFVESTFIQERPYMLRPVAHVWQKSVEILRAVALVALLAQEIDATEQ